MSASEYHPRQAAYDLKKLRGKDLVDTIGKSHRYETSAEGLRMLAASGILREKVLKPALRNCNLQAPASQSGNPVDRHYANLRHEIRQLLETLNIAA